MRQRQAIVFLLAIGAGEGDLILMPRPMHRIALEVTERVVHPPHVPLEVETQTAVGNVGCDARPGGGFLGNHRHARKFIAHLSVGRAQQLAGLDVFVPALIVGSPLAFLARVVQVQHRSHGIHTQSVGVKHVAPKAGVGCEKIFYLRLAVIEHRRAPVRVLTALRIGMLVQGPAIELRKRPVVLGKMRRHPVKDHSDASLVQGIDQMLKLAGRSIPARGRVKAGDLIAP